MDFKSAWKKLFQYGKVAANASVSAFEKAEKFTGDLLEKTADFTFDKIKTSPFCIVSWDMFDEVKWHKNLVVFVVADKEDTQSKVIIGRFPLLIGKAWQYSATLKIVYAQDLPDLVTAIGASAPSACIYKNGEQKFVLTWEKLNQFIESFDISNDWGEETVS